MSDQARVTAIRVRRRRGFRASFFATTAGVSSRNPIAESRGAELMVIRWIAPYGTISVYIDPSSSKADSDTQRGAKPITRQTSSTSPPTT